MRAINEHFPPGKMRLVEKDLEKVFHSTCANNNFVIQSVSKADMKTVAALKTPKRKPQRRIFSISNIFFQFQIPMKAQVKPNLPFLLKFYILPMAGEEKVVSKCR